MTSLRWSLHGSRRTSLLFIALVMSPRRSIAAMSPTWYTSSRRCHRRTRPHAISFGTWKTLNASAVTPRRLSWCVAIPKSPSLSFSPAQTKTLNGVRSRCSAWPRCRASSAPRTAAISRRTKRSDCAPRWASHAPRSPCSAYSSARQYRTSSPSASAKRSRTRSARSSRASRSAKYASRSQPDIRSLILMHTCPGNAGPPIVVAR